MQFNSEVLPFLEGKKFSNGLKVRISSKEKRIVYRLNLLEEIAKEKSIVHIGFADHLPLISKKIERNIWLHKRLMDSAERCIGLDIDSEVVDYVKNELKIEEVYSLNVITDDLPKIVKENRFHYLILGEVLEHIDNPVEFLTAIRKKFTGIAEKIVVTVPNAWDLSNLKLLKNGIEFINTDHRYWFTPYTLAKVGIRSGLTVDSFYFVQNYPVGSFIGRMILKRFPNQRETVVMIFNL